jgi:hypothetical protein
VNPFSPESKRLTTIWGANCYTEIAESVFELAARSFYFGFMVNVGGTADERAKQNHMGTPSARTRSAKRVARRDGTFRPKIGRK